MINIAFGFDDNFASHCGAAVASVLVNHKVTSEEDKIHFFFLGNISDENKARLRELKKIQDFEGTFISVDQSEFNGLPLRNGQKIAIYNVLLIPELVPDNVNKIIFLDCDLIVNKDITELWNTDVKDYMVAAVMDRYRKDENFFNSGVMVLNVKKLRDFDFYTKWKKYIEKNVCNMILHDQDILNPVLEGNVFFIAENWNVHHGVFLKLYDKFNKRNMKDFSDYCYIIHYSTKIKPWHPLPVHPLKDYYFKYALMTFWKDQITDYPVYLKASVFLKLLLKYWIVHPVFFIKKKFWKNIKKKGWLMTLY
jgi:Lipopolysaccharide biosynthesis proteins, LPS:glycosyltransferases